MKRKKGYYAGNKQVNVNVSDKGAEFNVDLKDKAKAKAKAEMDGSKMNLEGELEVAGTGGKVAGNVDPSTGNFDLQGEASVNNVKVRGGVGFEGVKGDSVRAATDSYYPDNSPWMTPYEMREGKTWSELSPERQQEYSEKLGFNESRWNKEMRR